MGAKRLIADRPFNGLVHGYRVDEVVVDFRVAAVEADLRHVADVDPENSTGRNGQIAGVQHFVG